ncbi:hypothetical protein OROMI_018695 [Orobanche minor]
MSQTDRHTMGLMSFARKQYELDKMEEDQMQRYIDGDTAYCGVMKSNNSISLMQLGRCSIIKEKSTKVLMGDIIIPDEYLQLVRAYIVKHTIGEVGEAMKISNQQFPPENLLI